MKNIFFFLFYFSVLALAQPQADIKFKTYLNQDVLSESSIKLGAVVEVGGKWHINSNKPNEDFLVPTTLELLDSTNFKLKNVQYPMGENITLGFSDVPLSVWQKKIIIISELISTPGLESGTYKVPVRLNYQACNDNTCLPPDEIVDTLTVVVKKGASANIINDDIFSATINAPKEEAGNEIGSLLKDKGMFLSLFFVFLMGLALNLTPCVYPLIPITIGYFGGQAEGNTKKLFLMGLLFVFGMAITYSIIGVVTALTGAIFGALLQNTYVIIAIAMIFIALSLSMFGVYEFRLPSGLMNAAGGAKSGMFGAFFMGLTMGIVAAPCIGPFVLGLVTYVAAEANVMNGLLLFFVLALGLGTPYLILAIFSGKLKSLPRAGLWMEAVKHIFGFILLGMAIYFLQPLIKEFISEEVSKWILPVYMFIAAIILLFFDKTANDNKTFRAVKYVVVAVLIAFAVFMLPKPHYGIEWEKYQTNMKLAAVESEKGMIIDFYADWCIPCKELDQITFADKNVIDEAKRFKTYKADLTKSLSPEVEELTKKYNVKGVPTVIIFNSKGEEINRITGFVEPEEFLKLLKEVKN